MMHQINTSLTLIQMRSKVLQLQGKQLCRAPSRPILSVLWTRCLPRSIVSNKSGTCWSWPPRTLQRPSVSKEALEHGNRQWKHAFDDQHVILWLLFKQLDIAFVDRADIKMYIGLPSANAIYSMFKASLDELQRAGIIQPKVCFFGLFSTKVIWVQYRCLD